MHSVMKNLQAVSFLYSVLYKKKGKVRSDAGKRISTVSHEEPQVERELEEEPE